MPDMARDPHQVENALVTFGECWHNNHHAFPRSARMGHSADEIDPGWLVIRALMIMGLAWNVTVPDLSRGGSRTMFEGDVDSGNCCVAHEFAAVGETGLNPKLANEVIE
jgi:hypothetical protein